MNMEKLQMKLLIKQRLFSWGDAYDIYDAVGNVKYIVKAKIFAFGHQLHVYDAYNNEVALIRQKKFAFKPQFEIEVGGRLFGHISERSTFFTQKYEVDFNGWRVEGNLFKRGYDVYDGCNVIIHISKKWLQGGDTYVIEFANPEDELMGIMLVIAIDVANCQED